MSNLPDPSCLTPATVVGVQDKKYKKSTDSTIAKMLRHTTELMITEDELTQDPTLSDKVHILDGISDKNLLKVVELVFRFYRKLDQDFEKVYHEDINRFHKYADTIKPNRSRPSTKERLPKKKLTRKEKLLLERDQLKKVQLSAANDEAIELQCRKDLGI